MQGLLWTLLSIFLKQGSTFFQENYSLPYQLCQLFSSSIPSCNVHISLVCNSGLHFNASILQSPSLFFRLFYHTAFILDCWYGLINLPHQLYYKLNVALIFKLYLFIWFSQFFKDIDAFIQFSLAIICHAYFLIFFWSSIISLL